MTITAAVDGSSLGNPGPAGWAWVIDAHRWAAGGWPKATNNVGELTALLELLKATAAAGLAGQELLVLADSQYVINSVTKWMASWRSRGWRKADGKPIANQDLIEQIDEALKGRSVRFQWVKGHAGHPLNEAADDRAHAAAQAFSRNQQPNRGPGLGYMAELNGALGVAPADSTPTPTRRLAASDQQLKEHYGFTEKVAAPKVDTLDVIPAQQVPQRWEEVQAAAQVEPVTISRTGAPSLVLLDADLAWQALAALDNPVDPKLF